MGKNQFIYLVFDMLINGQLFQYHLCLLFQGFAALPGSVEFTAGV